MEYYLLNKCVCANQNFVCEKNTLFLYVILDKICRMKTFFEKYIVLLCLLLLVASCFTGIENTKKITNKDVAKVIQDRGTEKDTESVYNRIEVDSFPDWDAGKCFIVVDDNVKRIFVPSSAYDLDTLNLLGKTLKYVGYTEGNVLDNEPKVNLKFTDGINEFVYSTKKTVEEIKRQKLMLQVPFMIETDLIDVYQRQIGGKSFCIRTPIWYNENGDMISGKKFIKVTIDNVYAGDKVFPLRVSFVTEDGTKAYLFMSTKQSSVQNRLFDNLFSTKDIRLNYPLISDVNWNHIVNGTVTLDMTKDECRLSLGTPTGIQERPTNDGLQEYWFYSDGMYLVFFDGLLKQFRK